MTAVVYIAIYAALGVFVVASAVRAWRYARAPVHLRWELYPVPHEPRERLEHGGSYFEVHDWWTAKEERNLLGEILAMAREIVLLEGVWHANRPLWFRTFPFHFGLYLLFATAALLSVTAAATLWLPALTPGGIRLVLHYGAEATGAVGTVFLLVGALALLHRRTTDPALRIYTTPGDVFNLLVFLVAVGLLGVGYVTRPEGSAGLAGLTAGLLSFDTSVTVPPLLAAGLCLSALVVAYIPLTHMAHFVAKYFTYHAVRWDDEPAHAYAAIAAKVAECVKYKPTWAAKHVGADGARTWGEVVTTNPAQGDRR
jgi:nitrate reductase gamma subunit